MYSTGWVAVSCCEDVRMRRGDAVRSAHDTSGVALLHLVVQQQSAPNACSPARLPSRPAYVVLRLGLHRVFHTCVGGGEGGGASGAGQA